jgi:aldose 1-epimerase
MPDGDAIILRAGQLTAMLDRRGAVIAAFQWRGTDGVEIPLMRSNAAYAGDPLTASCFPLLPFCNRVRDNRFSFEGRPYSFEANQPWDRHYLHGDGWLTDWDVRAQTPTSVIFAMQRAPDASSPYAYAATIAATLTPDRLRLTLGIENTGDRALPFGLGLHPYFPLTAATTLYAPAQSFFTEEAEFMPGERLQVPDDLDFARPRTPPRRWINNGFSGWDGHAEIMWSERGLALRIAADAAFRDYFVFMSDTRFEPGFAGDYFCFEPMTHHADAHHAADLGGLVVLAPGQLLSGSVSFSPREVPMSDRNVP